MISPYSLVCPTGCATCTSAKLCQSCVYGYNVHFTDVCALDITPGEVKEVKGMAKTTEATDTASTVISSVYAFMNSGDPTAMFMGSLAKMLQYVKYINIEYPPKIKLLFGLRGNVNDTSESIVTKVQVKIEDTSHSPQLSNNFGYYKLTSSFVSNNLVIGYIGWDFGRNWSDFFDNTRGISFIESSSNLQKLDGNFEMEFIPADVLRNGGRYHLLLFI